MGLKGTEVAKEASDMILLDDNFATIVAAAEEGRSVFNNVMKCIVWNLPTSGGEALTIIIAIALGQHLPLLPVQLLWVNMITAVTLGLTLAFEPREAGLMDLPPRPPDSPILTPRSLFRIIFVSILVAAGTVGLFLWNCCLKHMTLAHAQTIAVATLVFYGYIVD